MAHAKRNARLPADPERLAFYALTVPEVITALRNANSSATAGIVDEGNAATRCAPKAS